ncbi:23S rRNA (guanosine(2251)-2'-O)-methyltransferase RlmB [Pelolinea submarina]|uniref:23S rRNA (Guanosine2251-2'-O)-methyltransferase n=1 Tax=Pelolinea submarina TaxID=913107 RepID=A0A347ZRJ5_9CHLR|nr:23S rRNA (guanosine(2251)-2'-O)-methyltransferase RlmB [Pelolinea submarina]REG11518.1 23S rRNA (guanosine2251-2'-O)-methyltransferase [Pelolinea submarina]BBB47926.1 23S rRNA (guanosine2251-2'-O)-methyltransferase [Pelolinea submarina]
MKEWITGRNPVYECLRVGRRHFFRLQLAKGVEQKGRIPEILTLAKTARLNVEWVDRDALEEYSDNPQGVALQASEYPYADLQAIFDLAKKKGEPLFMLILDQIQDPQNMGTLIRSAEVFGVHGMVIPAHRSAGVTPAVVNASSGASEHLLIAPGNLAQAIDAVKEQNGWVIGLDMDSSATPLSQTNLKGNLAIVVGSEGEGLRRLVREKCDLITYIPMRGKVASLNAATAGSIVLQAAAAVR